MRQLQYGSVHVTVDGDGRLVTASVVGAVRRAHAQRIMCGAREWSPQRLAQVVDYSAARIEVDADALYRAAVQTQPPSPPTALVVPRDSWAMFHDYARMQAARGILKGVFLTREAADRWAAEQVQVREFWARAAGVLGSSP